MNDILGRLIGSRFLRYPGGRLLPIIERPRVLEAWLRITDWCSRRCPYCFLPHDPVEKSLEIGLAAIDAVFRSALTHQYTRVKLKYAGGKAMLRLPSIAELRRYAQGLFE